MATPMQVANADEKSVSELDPDVVAKYEVGEVLGRGAFSVVYAAVMKTTGLRVALKAISRARLGTQGERSVHNEIRVMTLLNHPLLLKLHQVIYSRTHIYLILDRIEGGELFTHIMNLGHYSERTAAFVMRNLITGIKAMHDEGVVHRDIKPENLLLVDKPKSDNDQITKIKIGDFGFATRFVGEVLTQTCGTPYYVAPEIVEVAILKTRTTYNELCDLWSAGVVAHLLLSGQLPFITNCRNKLYMKIVKDPVRFTAPVWDAVSPLAKDFVSHLLEKNPQMRFTAEAALRHDFLALPEESLSGLHLQASQEGLREFNAKEKLKGSIFGVEAVLRMQYLLKCKEDAIKPNTQLLEQFSTATEAIRCIDLSNNYLGKKGLKALLEVVAKRTEVVELNLTCCNIDDSQLDEILAAISAPSCKVSTLILDNNKLLTHGSARKLLAHVLSGASRLRKVTMEGAHVSANLKRRLESALVRTIHSVISSRHASQVLTTNASSKVAMQKRAAPDDVPLHKETVLVPTSSSSMQIVSPMERNSTMPPLP